MTQIRGSFEVTRREGVLGVHSLDHFCMAVPDLQKAKEFYEAFGLTTRRENSNLALYTEEGRHRWGLLVQGPKKRLSYLSFGAFADDLPGFKERLSQLSIETIRPPLGDESAGLWFRDYDGTIVEIKAATKSSPNEKSSFDAPSSIAGVRGALTRSQSFVTTPRRLAHLALYTRDVHACIGFYSSVLGLRVSDTSEGNVAFMHAVHGSDHHLIAFAKSAGAGLHHCSWDVGSVQEIGLGAMQMAERGFERGWGLGRHVLGANYFHYVRDPWGSYSEYSADMDFIPAGLDWRSGEHRGEDSFYLWGPRPPDDFVLNYEIEA